MEQRAGASDTGAANLRFARALVGELRTAGAAAAVVCPGSRSAPLAIAVAECDGLPHSVHVDERSAAFYALGHAKACGRPVVIICTSGTAGANFLPAVAEARHSRVPLIVLTADRPPELRAWGAAQTMEQRTLYAGFARWSEEAPCPSERPAEDGYARALARRAVSVAMGPAPGPVHLNLPFREPLLPGAIDVPSAAQAQAAAIHPPLAEPEMDDAGALARELHRVDRGAFVFGPDAWDAGLADEVNALATALDWPVIADPASGLRAGLPQDATLIPGADLLLRDADTAASFRPDLVVRFGSLPTSKAIGEWIGRHVSADVWLVDAAGEFRDPQHRAGTILRMTSRQFCALAQRAARADRASTVGWRTRWDAADRVARAAAASAIDKEQRFLTPHLARALWAALPGSAALYVANSMTIREIDAFAGPRAAPLRVLANRGVNGIDGLVSAACGAAAALGCPTVLWCGDLALLHDVSGLLAGTMHNADLTIVVSNDDGGGIFEYLPAARVVRRPLFERMFAVAHGLDLCGLARGLGWEANRVDSAAGFETALSRALSGGRHVIEVPVDRAANTAFHAAIHAAVSARLRREMPA